MEFKIDKTTVIPREPDKTFRKMTYITYIENEELVKYKETPMRGVILSDDHGNLLISLLRRIMRLDYAEL